MRRAEGYLSRVAASTWPGAVVWSEEGAGIVLGRRDHPQRPDRGRVYALERPGEEPVVLGSGGFTEARSALAALRHLHRLTT